MDRKVVLTLVRKNAKNMNLVKRMIAAKAIIRNPAIGAMKGISDELEC